MSKPNESYTVQIIETYHGEEISAELFESVGLYGLDSPERPFGVRVFDPDADETVPFGVHRFATLDAARVYFGGVEG